MYIYTNIIVCTANCTYALLYIRIHTLYILQYSSSLFNYMNNNLVYEIYLAVGSDMEMSRHFTELKEVKEPREVSGRV